MSAPWVSESSIISRFSKVALKTLHIVEDPGESIVVCLLVPVGEVILVVCHFVLAHVAGHQQRVLRISLGYFVLHKKVLKFTQRGLYFGVVEDKLEIIFPSFYSVSLSK